MWIVISPEKLEGAILRVAVDDVHDLLSCRPFFLPHDLARRCDAVAEAPIFLQEVLHSVGPYTKVTRSFEMVCFLKSAINGHRVVSKAASPLGALGLSFSLSFYR